MSPSSTSLIKTPPPYDWHRSLGIVLLYGPEGWRFRISEVTLYRGCSKLRTSISLGSYSRASPGSIGPHWGWSHLPCAASLL